MGAKQVIAVNAAVPYSIGRICAQACHASLLSILNKGKWSENGFYLSTEGDPALHSWLTEAFTKIIVKVWGEKELLSLQESAQKMGIATALMIEDDGQRTALALGPCNSNLLDKLTHNLILL